MVKKLLSLLSVAFVMNATAVNAQSTVGLVAHWPFNGNTTDSTSNGHNGTAHNITYTSGRNSATGSAAIFNGTNTYVTAPYKSDLNVEDFSICAIFKINAFNNDVCQQNTIMQRGASHSLGNYTMCFMDTIDNCNPPADTNANTIVGEAGQFNINVPTSSWQYPYVLHTGQWYSAVLTFNKTKILVYINGVLRDSAFSTAGTVPLGTSTDSIFIGATYLSPSSPLKYAFIGHLDDLRLYSRVLTPSEITDYSKLAVNNTTKDILSLDLYPNPASGSITISGKVAASSTQVGIDLINALGQTVQKETLTAANGQLNHKLQTENMVSGTYRVRIYTQDAIEVKQLVIQH